MKLIEGKRGSGDDDIEEKEDMGSNIAKFSGADRSELRRWKVQLALRLVRKARTYITKQK